GFSQLSPDQRITAVAYALTAESVSDGAITASKIAPGAIDSTKLAPGAAADNLSAGGFSALVRGGIVLSAEPNSTNLLSAGYSNLGQTTVGTGNWRLLTNGPPLGDQQALRRSRRNHLAVWTGTEMIIWGGTLDGATFLNTGSRYNPMTESWTPTSTN